MLSAGGRPLLLRVWRVAGRLPVRRSRGGEVDAASQPKLACKHRVAEAEQRQAAKQKNTTSKHAHCPSPPTLFWRIMPPRDRRLSHG